ncbi:unnamed protein product [Adineta steineri]|uniref:Poly [ADP-ribose] polymerase n=1 Tax=Adineta steineri TaxID=433720 RepID=A0A819B5Q5_9BILA|nr:unnamed protein product [Adineta steineri]
MDTSTSSSSDDESIVVNKKTSKKVVIKRPKKVEKKKNVSIKSKSKKQTRSKNTNIRQKSQNTYGLDGTYWNLTPPSNSITKPVINYSKLNGDDSSSEDSISTVSKNSSSDDDDILYENETFVTCRNPSDGFYLCQILQDVYKHTKKISIRWCSVIGEKGDDTEISIRTRFNLTYMDKLDPCTILYIIPNIIHHEDDTLALKKQDIVETKRLLQKSIHGESLSSDDMMDLSTEHSSSKKKSEKHIHFKSNSEESNSSASSTESVPTNKKRKIRSNTKKSRKQPPKKRVRKTPVKRTTDASESSDNDENEDDTPKKKKTKKPVRVRKTQLFKVHSNSTLEENSAVKVYDKEPFFEDNLSVPFISSFVQSKLAIRAVLLDDTKLLKSLIDDVDHVCSVHVNRGLYNDLTPLHYAIKNNNIEMVKILLDDIKTPKKNRCPFPTVSMVTQSTGSANVHTFGFRTAQLMASRGAKEGNNALDKERMISQRFENDIELIQYAMKNNCSREIYELLFKLFKNTHGDQRIYESIHKIIAAGHRKLAASIIHDIKDNTFHGFNQLHYAVLFNDNEDLTINRAASVLKKTQANFMITPIHCAAINPNAKYLKQLLNTMPEYNILDKYERRPIHFAAACEGSDPLEYLISKQVTFNDVDRGGNSPLHIAAMNGRSINAELLLRTAKEKSTLNETDDDEVIHNKFGFASINRMNKSRFYPLHLAVLNNHLDVVKVLVDYEADIDAITKASIKITPLMLACQKGYFDIVKYLISKGAKIEFRDRFQRTPLIHACMCGNADIVSYLLYLGANANVFDSSLNTALHYVIAYGWYFCVRILLEAGANINCVNSWQTTCLATGFLKGHYGLCDYLLTDHNADINFRTEDGLTLVMLTVNLQISSSVVQQLEYVVNKHKADCTTIDANGNNAFHYLAGNLSDQNQQNMDNDVKNLLRENYFKICEILYEHNCDPNKMNNKSQSPLMIALQMGNFILVDYLVDKAKVNINSDISHDGKTLVHYFAQKCEKYNLIQILLKLPITDEIKTMGQIFDNSGRTPLHYCASKFNRFCEKHKKSKGTEQLKKKYESITQMIVYCLEAANCDPNCEIKSADEIKIANKEETDDDDDNDEEEEEEEQANSSSEDDEEDEENEDNSKDDSPIDTEKSDLKLKETSIFSLLRTVSFIDNTTTHPLEIFLKKSKNLNVLHHKTHRTPLLEAIHLRQIQTAQMLINNSLCDINLSTSNLSHERQQTPLISACILQLLPVIDCLLKQNQCDISSYDYNNNQAIHYFLQTSDRTNDYIDILNIFVTKLKNTSKNSLNIQGKHQRTPLHIAVYHNLGTIDAITNIEKILIDNGSDLLIKDNLGNIPLHNVFLNKNIHDDPVELCVLILKSMKYKNVDTKNNEGNTPLHLAVTKCSTVCVMLLQQHNANLLIENNLSNSIIGTCIASYHLNLFITFLQQSNDIDLGKLHNLLITNISSTDNEQNKSQSNKKQQPIIISKQKKDEKNLWKWNFSELQNPKEYQQYSLIYLIIERDWQGALSLILNDIDHFHLTYLQIIETAILNNKLNLVLRLLLRLKDEINFLEINSSKQNLFHLIANINEYNENLLKQILLFLNQYDFNWNTKDIYGCYPLHYACIKQNYIFIDFLREKYTSTFDLYQIDSFNNTANGLLFWSLGSNKTFSNEKLRLLILSGKQLDCLCNYNDEILLNSLSFGYIHSIKNNISYPPMVSNNRRISPLIHAIIHNNIELVKFLLELNADVNFCDELKQTPLMYAVRQNNIDIVKLLLNKDHSLENNQTLPQKSFTRKVPRRRNFFLGVTTMDSNEISNKNKSITFELTSSINLNAIDNDSRTCIHHLIHPCTDYTYRNNIEILQLLHSCGALLTKTDRFGLTPLQYTQKNNSQHLFNELTKLISNKTNSIQSKIEPFTVNDPNKNLLTKTDFYNDAQQLIDDYILSHPVITSNTAYNVDKSSGMNLTGEVLIDTDKNEPYDVRLTKIDVGYGIMGLYNFYRMQIIKHKSKNNLFFLFTHWGRIGDAEGQHQLTPYSTIDECQKEFQKVFREKTGNLWKDTNTFQAKPKKYMLIELNKRKRNKHSNVPIDFDRLQTAESQHSNSKLQSSIYKNLLQTLISRQAIRHNIHKTHLDIDWMPVSQLKRETLEKARDLLISLKDVLEKQNENNSPTKTPDQKNELYLIKQSIYQYTNEYYTLIPLNGYSEEKLPIIDNIEALKAQEKVLDDLFELELSYKMLLGAQANLKNISPLDYLYKSINCQFEAMNRDDIDSQFILRYIWASEPTIDIEQIFKIARPNEDERLRKRNLNNHYLLWHGTSICNLISILTRGLLVGSLVANATGSLFGKGIYTADVFKKSLGYCSGVKQNDNERCFMLLCDVALGNIKEVGASRVQTNDDDDDEEDEDEVKDDDAVLDLKKYQSRKGVGRSIPDPKHTIVRNDGVQIPLGQLIDNKNYGGNYYGGLNHNEYIVYDESQVAIRYLVQFRR